MKKQSLGFDPASVPYHRIRSVRKKVLDFYSRHGRHELPWRTTYSSYHVLVSEIMLQQTQVPRVIDKFQEFVAAFPTMPSLADARLDSVLRAWQGLGYNRRGMLLHRCARTIMSDFDGDFPRTPDLLESLPGIGPATARSIAAFAFNSPEVFLETNIRTVLIHHFLPEATEVHDNVLLPLAARVMDRKNPRQWYSAIMDYGTALKKTTVNPSRRSLHYKRQSPFSGSDRQIRGRIIRSLLSHSPISGSELVISLQCEPTRADRILSSLISEGLVSRDGARVFINTSA